MLSQVFWYPGTVTAKDLIAHTWWHVFPLNLAGCVLLCKRVQFRPSAASVFRHASHTHPVVRDHVYAGKKSSCRKRVLVCVWATQHVKTQLASAIWVSTSCQHGMGHRGRLVFTCFCLLRHYARYKSLSVSKELKMMFDLLLHCRFQSPAFVTSIYIFF